MSKEDGILRYKTAMAVFKNWLAEGVLSDADLVEIDTILAQKYGLSSCSMSPINSQEKSYFLSVCCNLVSPSFLCRIQQFIRLSDQLFAGLSCIFCHPTADSNTDIIRKC